MLTPTDRSAARSAGMRRIAVAAGFGNFMEWFDFAVYGFFATTIGHVFFPSSNPTSELLSALAVFGIAFFMRPLGGVILGVVGDRVGRRAALSISILMMGISTTLVAALPSYESVGLLAPVLLVLLRCLQGLSAGGEWAGSSSFLVEYAPRNRRALWGSVVTATAALGSLGGALVAIALTQWLTPGPAGGVGLADPVPARRAARGRRALRPPQARGHARLSRAAARAPRRPRAAARGAEREPQADRARVLLRRGRGARLLLPRDLRHQLPHLRRGRDGEAAGAGRHRRGLAVYAALCPLAGLLSDRIGRKPSMVLGSAGLALFAIPAFVVMSSGSVLGVVLAISGFAIFEAMVNVTTVVLLVELFPARTRMSGGSIGFNVALAAIGGPGPLIAAALASGIAFSGAGAFYMVAVALVSMFALARLLPETRGVDLGMGEAAPVRSQRFTRTPVREPVRGA